MRYWVFLALLLCTTPHLAQAQMLQGTYSDWRLFTARQDGENLCYIASTPTTKKGNYSRRSPAYLFVTYVKGGTHEVSTTSGYRYDVKKDVRISVTDGKTYGLFAENEMAWAKTSKDDSNLIADMIAKGGLTVRGNSWKGTYSEDSYSLRGFSAAYKAMKSKCK